MPDPGSFPFSELMSSLSSVVVVMVVGAAFLVLWQLAILLGALIANLKNRREEQTGGKVGVS